MQCQLCLQHDLGVRMQALGSIAFAYSFSFILLEITVRLENPLCPPSVHKEAACLAVPELLPSVYVSYEPAHLSRTSSAPLRRVQLQS